VTKVEVCGVGEVKVAVSLVMEANVSDRTWPLTRSVIAIGKYAQSLCGECGTEHEGTFNTLVRIPLYLEIKNGD